MGIEKCRSQVTGCNASDAVSIKTTIGETTYYFSAYKPAKWVTVDNIYHRAIYLFRWGNHN